MQFEIDKMNPKLDTKYNHKQWNNVFMSFSEVSGKTNLIYKILPFQF